MGRSLRLNNTKDFETFKTSPHGQKASFMILIMTKACVIDERLLAEPSHSKKIQRLVIRCQRFRIGN